MKAALFLAAAAAFTAVDATAPPPVVKVEGVHTGSFFYLLEDFLADKTITSALPATGYPNLGLTLTPGLDGAAYLSGTIKTLPAVSTSATCGTGNYALYKIKASDDDEASLCIQVLPSSVFTSMPSFVFPKTPISGTKGVGDIVDGVNVFPTDADSTTTTIPDPGTVFTFTSTVVEATKIGVTYFGPSAPKVGSTLYDGPVSEAITYTTDSYDPDLKVATFAITSLETDAEAVNTALEGVTYKCNAKAPAAGDRSVHFAVYATVTITTGTGDSAVDTDHENVIIAAASRSIALTLSNSAPVVTLASPSNLLWTEGDDPVAIANAFAASNALTDADDSAMTAAYITIATSSGTGYGACDSSRDQLGLPTARVTTPVAGITTTQSTNTFGVWDEATCTLKVTPQTGIVTVSEFLADLEKIVYKNNGNSNPTNYVDCSASALAGGNIATATEAACIRQITITVVDDAVDKTMSSGKSSIPKSFKLVLASVDDAPVFKANVGYSKGGVFYSYHRAGFITDAAVKVDNKGEVVDDDDGTDQSAREFFVTYTPGVAEDNYFKFEFDFSKTKDAEGNVVPGSWANGAIIDTDSKTLDYTWLQPILTEPTTTDVVVGICGVTTVEVQTPATVRRLADANPPVVPEYINCRDGFYNSTFDDKTGIYTLWVKVSTTEAAPTTTGRRLDVNPPTPPTEQTPNEEQYFKINFSPFSVEEEDDDPIRYPVNFDALFIARPRTCPYATVTTLEAYFDNTVCTEDDFPDNLFTSAGANDETIAPFTTGDFDDVTGFDDEDDTIDDLAQKRVDVRGNFKVVIPPKSFTSLNDVDFSVTPVIAASKNKLPSTASPEDIPDYAIALKLRPAGMVFSEPVQVCIYVGDVPSAYSVGLFVASQKDSTDETKGYKNYEAANSQTYEPRSGLLCAYVNHFSVAIPIAIPLVVPATEQKFFQMGASCPNDCSGKGYCRESGRCVCFAGFQGWDCSERMCPVDQSWDTNDVDQAHGPSECSDRGKCDRKTGECACFDGYSGAACQRIACPNDCTGNGKCRLLSELAGPQSSGWLEPTTKFEASRVQVCQCDGGFTGPDCSQRVCPFGDDPETVCKDDKRQEQKITIDFSKVAAGAVIQGDIVLIFRDSFGRNYTTRAISDVDNADGADDTATGIEAVIETALKSLPGFAISDVTVTAAGGQIANGNPKVDYTVTFDAEAINTLTYKTVTQINGIYVPVTAHTVAGNTVTGNQIMLECPTFSDSKFLTGCSGAGCSPQFNQLRVVDLPADTAIKMSEGVILQQPVKTASQLDNSDWAVTVSVIVNAAGTAYSVSSTVYNSVGESIEETPIPPADLRKNVELVYGLGVDFVNVAAGTTYTFKWRLPTCSVVQLKSADDNYEKVECSRRGICDRKAGECVCLPGYHGYNCGQQTVIF